MKSFPLLSSWLVSKVGFLRTGKTRPAVTEPGMEWASSHLTSGCGSYRREQVSCRLTTEVAVGTESLGGSGVLLVSVLFSFIVTIPLPPLLIRTCPILTCMCTCGHILPLPGWLVPFPQTQMPSYFGCQPTNSSALLQVGYWRGWELPCCLVSQLSWGIRPARIRIPLFSSTLWRSPSWACPPLSPGLMDPEKQLKLLPMSGSQLSLWLWKPHQTPTPVFFFLHIQVLLTDVIASNVYAS